MSSSETGCLVLHELPDGFLDCAPDQLVNLLPHPTLIDLRGEDPRALFLSTLLHGNEESGLKAVQLFLRRHLSQGLKRSLLLFIGNPRAASQGRRTLPGDLDHNRIWPGGVVDDDPLVLMARFVYEYAQKRRLFASIDIHNNTGFNPHYSCTAKLDARSIALAKLFSNIIVHFERPLGTHAAAFANLCPAMTVECGKAGESSAVLHALSLIESCMSLTDLSPSLNESDELFLLRTCAIVRLPHDASLSFDGRLADFMFRKDLDSLNFKELAAGAHFGSINNQSMRLEILPGDGFDSTPAQYFDYAECQIRMIRSAIPAMLTLDPLAVKQDCLCYFMHRINLEGRLL